jgi:hypothetical protein
MFGHVWHVTGKQFVFVQELVRIVKEVQGGVFESGICLGDAQSIDKVKGKNRFGWLVCRFWLR